MSLPFSKKSGQNLSEKTKCPGGEPLNDEPGQENGEVLHAAKTEHVLPEEVTQELRQVIRILACKLHSRLPPGSAIEVSDLIQCGNVGVLKATQRFRADCGATMQIYAKFRIRGEMLDLVRRENGRGNSGPGPNSPVANVQDPEEVVAEVSEGSPQNAVLRQQRAAIIWEELQRLPARDRALVRLRYLGEMTLRQIGEVLQVNESRACQIHQSILIRLKQALSTRGVRDFSQL